MKKIVIPVLSIIVIALIAGYVVANRSHGTDSDQITAVMERGRQAIERKSTSQASSCISKDYSDDLEMNHDKICTLAAQAFTAQCNYEVVLSAPQIDVKGQEAEARTHLRLSSVTSSDRTEKMNSEIVLHFKKEPARRFLIYPTMEWKVVKIEGIDRAIDFGL
jgi:uncharacterized protein YxeA